jgi:type IV secretory pathway TraG/TraD family ATPase VirD4
MKRLRIRESDSASHLVLVGDTGTGKSQLLCQILDQIQARGDIAVILDTQNDGFLTRYFRPERGDWVLNPKDERCPYWNIFDEATDEADAMAVANSLFPEPPVDINTSAKFFHSHTVGVASYLLAYGKNDDGGRPTTADLGYWMAHPGEIDKRIKGSEHEHTLTANAAPQRAGILGTLNTAGRSLRMMPTTIGARRQFCVRDWVEQREGWIFVSNTQDTRDALRPLQSMWLDLLILRLLAMGGRKDLPRVWILLDELASLQTLPKLHTALTEMRKTGNVMVLAFQNFADLEALYGRKASTIFSQPKTKLVFRTSHAGSAKELQDLVGEVELLRVRETHGMHVGWHRRRDTQTTDKVREPLVMASQIQGLRDLHGYMIQPGMVVPVALPYIERPVIAPALIERTIPPMEKRPAPPDDPWTIFPQPEPDAA